MDELYRKLLAQLEEGQDTVLAFITEGDGSIPRTTGACMLVGREGRIFGTIGGGNLEYQAVLHAQELVQEKKSEYREYDLGTGEGKGLGMVCGGRVKVCFYFMNGAHGEAESLAQALAAGALCRFHISSSPMTRGCSVREIIPPASIPDCRPATSKYSPISRPHRKGTAGYCPHTWRAVRHRAFRHNGNSAVHCRDTPAARQN